MTHRNIALLLAVVAAMASPFLSGTWQPRANAQAWVALTPELRAALVARLESSKNCRYFETQVEARDVLGLDVDSKDIDDAMQCHREQDALRDGGEARPYFSLPRYLAINAAVAAAGAAGVFAMALMLAAAVRWYRWRIERASVPVGNRLR